MTAAREFLQRLATETGRNVGDLLTLAPANDPFNCGTKGDREKAAWFVDQWQRVGVARGVHLRRIHYVLVSHGDVRCRDGKPYENTLESWHELNVCSKAARYLGLVPLDAFDDRRNPPPVVYGSRFASDGGISRSGNLPAVALAGLDITWPYLQAAAPRRADDWHLELWCEKSTMNDVLLPICERRGANLVTGLGELSITAVDGLIQRMRARQRPCRVFYLSDYDPAGRSMPVAVARKAQFMLWKDAEQTGVTPDLRIYPLVLTGAQIQKYKLPRVPIKESERRRESFESRHGSGATELDALEALHPGELGRIIKRALGCYRDSDYERRLTEARRAAQAECDRITDDILAQFAESTEDAERDLDQRVARVREWVDEYRPLYNTISATLWSAAPALPEWPEPAYPDEADGALFDSTRSYIDQHKHFQAFQSGDGE
jgi:hypothetical protein